MNDWLGNPLEIGSQVLYTSKSVYTGMNKGELLTATPEKIQIRIPVRVWDDDLRQMVPGTRIMTLQKGTGAYKSVTRYYGPEN